MKNFSGNLLKVHVYTDTYQWHIGGTSLDKASKDFSDLYS